MKKLMLIIGVTLMISCTVTPQGINPESQIECDFVVPLTPTGKRIASQTDSLARKGLVGLAIDIIAPGFHFNSSAGKADIENNIAMKPCHLQHTASLYKTLLAVVILQMAEEGKFDLTDKLSQFLPDQILKKIPNGNEVTIEHLLQNRSGIPDVFELDFLMTFFNDRSRQYGKGELLKFVEGRKPAFEPGNGYYYSDANFILLTMLADTFESDYFQTRIFKPLNLKNTYFIQKGDEIPFGIAQSYEDKFGKLQFENISMVQTALTTGLEGTDGIVSTPEDMNIFLRSLFNGDLLNERILEKMMNIHETNEETLTRENISGYGLGLMEVTIDGTKWVGHLGNHVGSAAMTLYQPEKQIYLSAFTNTGSFFSDRTKRLFFYDLIRLVQEMP